MTHHKIHIDRLQNYTGIQRQALRWFRSYLSDRHHFVYLNEEQSKIMSVNDGVPQGSVLGPLLLSIYSRAQNPTVMPMILSYSIVHYDQMNSLNCLS